MDKRIAPRSLWEKNAEVIRHAHRVWSAHEGISLPSPEHTGGDKTYIIDIPHLFSMQTSYSIKQRALCQQTWHAHIGNVTASPEINLQVMIDWQFSRWVSIPWFFTYVCYRTKKCALSVNKDTSLSLRDIAVGCYYSAWKDTLIKFCRDQRERNEVLSHLVW